MGLPIAEKENEIAETIKENQVTIIVAETGAGKSTQVPQYLLRRGYELIITQPRRLATRTLAERVAEEYGCRLGGVVGYRTAFERQQSRDTKCLFVTDGLALIRELIGARKPNTVLVIDEVHEWNMNIEVLVAYTKWLIQKDKNIKVVLMSATLEADKLSAYFDDAPIVSVSGRLFPIAVVKPCGGIIEDTIKLLRQGRNVLVFQPGKKEIDYTINDLRKSGVNAEILPLHAEVDPRDQVRCFEAFRRPKCVVATNVAQTSITIPDIDAVVDSGLERRKELIDRVEGLYLKPISFADADQRKGRAGRCRPGIYIDHCHHMDRLEFPRAEILRSLLDQTVLRLAVQGFDAEELEFFHAPSVGAIHEAKKSLRMIGCMNSDNSVTEIGRRVARLPVSVKYGRMLVEAEDLDVVSEMLTIVSIFEVDGIVSRDGGWQGLCWNERSSDLLAQLAIYKAANGKDRKWMEANGVHGKKLRRAQEIRGHIIDAMSWDPRTAREGSQSDIIRAICAGLVEHVFVRQGRFYQNGSGPERRLNRDSVVNGFNPLLVGIPFDISMPDGYTINIINLATAVTPQLLMELAPHLVFKKEGLNPRYSYLERAVVSNNETYFGKHLISSETVLSPNHPEAGSIMRAREMRQNGEFNRHFGSSYYPEPIEQKIPEKVVLVPKKIEEPPRPAELRQTGKRGLASLSEL